MAPSTLEKQVDSLAGGSNNVDIIDDILTELDTKLSMMEEREGGVMRRNAPDERSVYTTNTEKNGDLNEAQRKYVREMVTAAMVKQIMARRIEKRKVPEIMKMSKKVQVDLAPKMKSLVDRLAEATANNADLQAQIKAIALLGGLEDEDIPNHEVLFKLAREDISKKLKYMSLKDTKRAEKELSVSLEDCREGIIDALCKSKS